jgi:hypothetical protein
MTLAPGGGAGNPRDAEVERQLGDAQRQHLMEQAAARREAKEARGDGWLRRLLRRGTR